MDNRVVLKAGANRHPLVMSRTVIVLAVAAGEKHRKRTTSRASDQVTDGYIGISMRILFGTLLENARRCSANVRL